MGPLELVGAVVAAALLAYVPGRIWVQVLLPGMPGGEIERGALAVALSVATVALAVYLGNVAFGVPVEGASALAFAAGISLVGLGLLALPTLQTKLSV